MLVHRNGKIYLDEYTNYDIKVVSLWYNYRVRNFRGRVSNFNQSEARKECFLASDWLKFETLPQKFRTL